MPLKIFYVSLQNGLEGYYLVVQAECREDVVQYATDYLGKIWREVYTEAYFREIIRKRFPHASRVVNRGNPITIVREDE